MTRPVSLNVDDLYDWWDDAIAAANLRAQVRGSRQTVAAAGDLWVVQEADS